MLYCGKKVIILFWQKINFKIKKQSAENWTIMIYGHADHNLTPAMIEDLLEMEQSGSDANINILAQVDMTRITELRNYGNLNMGLGLNTLMV